MGALGKFVLGICVFSVAVTGYQRYNAEAGTVAPPVVVAESACAAPMTGGYIRDIGHFDSARNDGRSLHNAVDIDSPTGTPIYAVMAGHVDFAGETDPYGWGRIVYIRHANGSTALYAHVSEVYVSNGQQVEKGQLIAAVGHAGNASEDLPHLHLELGDPGDTIDTRGGRKYTDPQAWLKACGGWLEPWNY